MQILLFFIAVLLWHQGLHAIQQLKTDGCHNTNRNNHYLLDYTSPSKNVYLIVFLCDI